MLSLSCWCYEWYCKKQGSITKSPSCNLQWNACANIDVCTLIQQRKHKSRITAMEMQYLRAVCGKTRRDRVRNDWVLEQCAIKDSVVDRMGRATLRWFSHIERINEERLTRRIYVGNVEGKKIRGRPRKQWLQHVDDVMKEREIRSERNNRACRKDVMSVDEARRVCGDREKWESLIYYVTAHP